MAVVHYTVREIRGLLHRAISVYEPRAAAEDARYRKVYAEWREARDRKRAEDEAQRQQWEKAKEERIRELVEEQVRKESKGWFTTPRPRDVIEKEVRENTVFLSHPASCTWDIAPLIFWPEMNEPRVATNGLTFCRDLVNTLADYDDDRVVGLTPAEWKMLHPDEDPEDLDLATRI